MPLQKQAISILLSKGRQDIVDSKTVSPGTPTRLVNAVFKKANRYSKRFGTDTLSNEILGGGQIEEAMKIETFDEELLLFSNDRVYTYAPNENVWVDKGEVPLIVTDVEEVVRNTEQQSSPDANAVSGTIVAAWEDTRGGIYGTAYDELSNAIRIQETQIAAAPATRPKTIAVGQFVFILYASGSTIRLRLYSSLSGNMFGPEFTLTSDLNATQFFDACVFANAVVLVWHTNANEIKISYVTALGVLGSPVTGFPLPATFANPVTDCLSLWADEQSGVLHVAWFDSALGLQIQGVKAVDFSLQYAPLVVDATLSPVVRNLTGVLSSPATSEFFYEVAATSPSDHLVKTATITALGVLTGPTLVARSVGLASKCFLDETGTHVSVVHDSPLQATYFLLDFKGLVHSRASSGEAGGLTPRASCLPESFLDSSGRPWRIGTVKTAVFTENNTTFTRTGLVRFCYDFRPPVFPKTAEFSGNLFLPGSFLQAYDGDGFVEAGYHLYPEGLSAVPSVGGGSMAAGTYLYYAMYEWIDAKGQLHRSAPSVPLAVTTTAPNSQVTLTIPTLRLTARRGTRTAPIIAVYRTEVNGQIPYRVSSRIVVSSTNGIVFSDPSIDSVAFTDLLADTSITDKEILYTAGGELESLPTPPGSAIAVFGNRLFLNTTDGTNRVLFSKEGVPTIGAQFNPLLSLTSDNSSENTIGLGVLDDKLILLKPYSAFATFGAGPNATGAGGAFSVPEKIATSTGCSSPASITSAKQGLFYKSEKGIRLLDRGLTEQPIGAPIQDLEGLTVAAGIVMPASEEIRFLHTDGEAAVYNDLFGQWSTFTNYAAVDAAVWRGKLVFAEMNGRVRVEEENTFTDNGQFYPMTIEMGWISLADIQGFQRIWRLLFLGEYKSPHKLRIRVGKNFEPSWNEVIYFDPSKAINQNTYGSSSPYGVEYLYGNGSPTSQVGKDSVYQGRIHLATQKCESIRFEITDLQISSNYGESLNLSALALEVGAKKGAFKASQAKSAGSLGD